MNAKIRMFLMLIVVAFIGVSVFYASTVLQEDQSTEDSSAAVGYYGSYCSGKEVPVLVYKDTLDMDQTSIKYKLNNDVVYVIKILDGATKLLDGQWSSYLKFVARYNGTVAANGTDFIGSSKTYATKEEAVEAGINSSELRQFTETYTQENWTYTMSLKNTDIVEGNVTYGIYECQKDESLDSYLDVDYSQYIVCSEGNPEKVYTGTIKSPAMSDTVTLAPGDYVAVVNYAAYADSKDDTGKIVWRNFVSYSYKEAGEKHNNFLHFQSSFPTNATKAQIKAMAAGSGENFTFGESVEFEVLLKNGNVDQIYTEYGGEAQFTIYKCQGNAGTYDPPTCSSFTYSDWSDCVDGVQEREILTRSPEACTGGNPVATQSCTSESDIASEEGNSNAGSTGSQEDVPVLDPEDEGEQISDEFYCGPLDSYGDDQMVTIQDILGLVELYDTSCLEGNADYGVCGARDANQDLQITITDLVGALSKMDLPNCGE